MTTEFKGETFLTAEEALGIPLEERIAEFGRQQAAASRAYLTASQNLFKSQREALLNAFPSDLRADPQSLAGYAYVDRNAFFGDAQKQVTFVNIIENIHPVSVTQRNVLKQSIVANLPAVASGGPADPNVISLDAFGISPNWPVEPGISGEVTATVPLPPQLGGPGAQRDADVFTHREDESATGIENEGISTTPGSGNGEDIPKDPGQDDTVDESDNLKAGRKEADENTTITPSTTAGIKTRDVHALEGPESTGVANPISIGPPVSVGAGGATGLTANVKEIKIDPRINELNNYSSYTYNVALYMLTPKEYIKMMKNPLHPKAAKKFLIARSGGIGAGEKPEAKHFDVDFFIDNLQLTNMGMSPNTQTTNTNAVEISFELNEPNGVTLLERLKAQAKLSLEAEQSYIHAPYLLEISFKGYDDHGTLQSGDIKPKYIPIKIASIKFSITNSGAIYRIKALPFHQNVFSNIHSNIPINIQVKAGTVKDIFGQAATAQVGESVREVVEPARLGQPERSETKIKYTGEETSLTSAINSFFTKLTKPSKQKDKTRKEATVPSTTNKADVWEFDMAPGIGDAKIMPSRFDALNTSGKTKKVYEQFSAGLRGQVQLVKDKQLFRINSGTNLIQLMNAIIVGSDYIKQNLLDDIAAAKVSKEPQGKQLQWFKIVPQIMDVVGWDSKAGRYKWRIKWTVVTNGIFYNDYAWAAQTKPKGKGVHKIYDYIFSGQNSEVLSFKLDFDAAYYQAVSLGTGIPPAADDAVAEDNQPMINPVAQPTDASGMGGGDTVKDKQANDLMSNIMHDGTDLMMANLDIIGDPAFLPVGDALFQPVGNRNAIYNEAFLPDGTINYDLTPTYVQVNLKTPTDYNDLTGFADPNQQHEYSSSQFSGVYQLLKTKSTLSGGVFTQNISAFRTKMQPIKGRVGRSAKSIRNTERKEFFQDVRQYAAALQYLSGRLPGIANNLGAKITNIANSAITNIGTDVIGRIASEVNQNRAAPASAASTRTTDFPEETLTQRDARSADHTDILIT